MGNHGGDHRPSQAAKRARLLARRIEALCHRERASGTFDVVDGGAKLANGRMFINCEKEETPDGFRVDIDGNLWCGWGMSPALDGVKVFNPAGKAIGFVALPERAANVCFGGRYRNRLFMAASHSIYSLYVNMQGVAGG